MTTTPDTIYYDEIGSPVGTLRLVADGHGLREIWFERERHPKKAHASWIRAAEPLAFARGDERALNRQSPSHGDQSTVSGKVSRPFLTSDMNRSASAPSTMR